MAVEVDSAFPYVPPSAERVVAEHAPYAIDHQFRILLNALPAIAVGDSGLIIVTGDEVLASMTHAQQANGEIAQAPDFIFKSDHRVPAFNHLPVHLGH
jgi:hypothetical protein